jgi:hypothetical protein
MSAPILRTRLATVLRTWTGVIAWRPTRQASRMLRRPDDGGIAPGANVLSLLFREVCRCIFVLRPEWTGMNLSHGPPRRGWRVVTPLTTTIYSALPPAPVAAKVWGNHALG